MTKDLTEKEMLYIANSAYGPNSQVSIEDWLKIQDAKRNNDEFRKRYKKLSNSNS